MQEYYFNVHYTKSNYDKESDISPRGEAPLGFCQVHSTPCVEVRKVPVICQYSTFSYFIRMSSNIQDLIFVFYFVFGIFTCPSSSIPYLIIVATATTSDGGNILNQSYFEIW